MKKNLDLLLVRLFARFPWSLHSDPSEGGRLRLSRDLQQYINLRTYINRQKINRLSKNSIELISRYIFNIKLYQFLAVVFIHVAVTSIQIDLNLFLEVLNNLPENLGSSVGVPELAKNIKLDSNINYILCYSHRSLFGFRTYILMVLILFIIFPILFIIQNYIFIILSILSVILVKALALNFYQKHFQFFYSGLPSHKKVDFREKLVHYITLIINNIGKIIKHLFKMWIISIIIIYIFRYLLATMLLNIDDNNSFIITILILTLPLPMFFYLLNFIVKYLKKESIEDKDYYLYNDYVVKRVNLYRITFTIIVNYLIQNYYSTIIISIIIKGFIVIIITFFTICIIYGILRINKPGWRASHFVSRQSTISCSRVDPLSDGDSGVRASLTKCIPPGERVGINKHEPIPLKSALDLAGSASYIAAFISLTPFLQEACNSGFSKFYFNEGNQRYYEWKGIPFRTPGVVKCGPEPTINIMQVRKTEIALAKAAEEARNLYKVPDTDVGIYYRNLDAAIEKEAAQNLNKEAVAKEGGASLSRYYRNIDETIKKKADYVPVTESVRQGLIKEYKDKLNNSPIVNITWKLKYNEGIQRSQANFTVKPINYFYNTKFYGAVSLVLKGRLLIVNIIRHDLPGCVFMPTYYLQNANVTDSSAKIRDITTTLESKYGIMLPQIGIDKVENRINGLIIFTQAESIDNTSLFRVWRPSSYYMEPELKTVKNYYQEKSQNNLRIREFDTTDSIKFSKDLKKVVGVQGEAIKIANNENFVIHEDRLAARKLAFFENTLDNEYRKLVEFYLTKGQKANPKDFMIWEEDGSDKSRLKFKDLMYKARSETKSAIQKDEYLLARPKGKEWDLVKFAERRMSRNDSNNEYMDNDCYYFKTRRDYPINRLLITRNQSHMTYFSMYKEGVAEGYKIRRQMLGELDASINLPLEKSRAELIKKIASKLTRSEFTKFQNIYGVSINRLTFEFFQLKPTDSKYFGINTTSTTFAPILDRNTDYELYSIIDVKNDSVKLPFVFKQGGMSNMTMPTHDYNMLDNRDEVSIRRCMDFIYTNSDGNLTYQSDKDNFSVLAGVDKNYPYQSDMDNFSVVKKKSVGFTKKAVDYKNKNPKSVKYTLDGFNNRFFRGKSISIELPFESIKLLDIIPHEYHQISLGGKRVNFDYEGEQRVKSSIPNTLVMKKTRKLNLEFTLLKQVYTTKGSNSKITLRFTPTWPPDPSPNGDIEIPNLILQVANLNNDSTDLNPRTLEAHYVEYDLPSRRPTPSTNLPNETPLHPSGSNEEEEDIYGYSGDEDNNAQNNREVASAVQASEQPPLHPSGSNEEEEDIYGYSGDEDNNAQNNREVASAVQASEQPPTVESPMELPFEDSFADAPYPYEAESPKDNDNNSGSRKGRTAVASGDQVVEGEEIALISADDMASEGDLAFSPQFFIPESTPDSISSDNSSPINTQANQGMGEILESNLVNRDEPMQVDGDLYREVMNNAVGEAVMESINPILLLPDLPTSNPEPVDTEDSPLSTEVSPLSMMSDSEFFELERQIASLKPSYLEADPGEVDGSGQDAADPEAIIISSDDSSSDSGDYGNNYSEASPITSLPGNRAGQMADPEAIIRSSDDSSSEGGPTPPKETDFIARPLNTPVAEVIHDRTGTRLLTVDIHTMLTVIGPPNAPEPRLWSVGNANYYLSMAPDFFYEHYPRGTEVMPPNNYPSQQINVYIPPPKDKLRCESDGRIGEICICRAEFATVVPLVNYPRSSYIEGALFMKSVLSSEPLGDKDLSDGFNLSDRLNFSSNSYTNAYFAPEPTPDTDSISSDNSSPINMQANQEEAGKPEVTLISADDMISEGDLAFSPQFFIPESTPDSISSDNSSPINTQANQGMGEILESNLVNRDEPMQVDEDLYREVMNNVVGEATMETINPILLLPDLPTSNPEPVDTEDSPLSTEDSPLSMMSDSEFFELEREISKLGKSIGRDKKGQSSYK
uniref:LV-uORF n=1 Tax=Fusarium cerealis TaxID=56641 RepID=A0A6G6B0E0_FUSCE|nr:LV-uORF [Fusarium cerealis]